ncbi:MAG: hypothetical protein LBQ00_03045 [Syntrophobacterales bacterium]|jgi:hypothetical protein|nr:hypothetical protein [Syntrophobacterales bacterium]
MGRKQTGPGKYFYLCIALLISVSVANCSFISSLREDADARSYIVNAQKLLDNGKYKESLCENQKALLSSPNGPPGDEALFNIGLLYANPANPNKDYTQAVASFTLLVTRFRQSPLAEQAKIWTDILQENARLKRASQEVLLENTRLKRIVEESKKVDVEISGMRRQ